jgi:hypothetical protein
MNKQIDKEMNRQIDKLINLIFNMLDGFLTYLSIGIAGHFRWQLAV